MQRREVVGRRLQFTVYLTVEFDSDNSNCMLIVNFLRCHMLVFTVTHLLPCHGNFKQNSHKKALFSSHHSSVTAKSLWTSIWTFVTRSDSWSESLGWALLTDHSVQESSLVLINCYFYYNSRKFSFFPIFYISFFSLS